MCNFCSPDGDDCIDDELGNISKRVITKNVGFGRNLNFITMEVWFMHNEVSNKNRIGFALAGDDFETIDEVDLDIRYCPVCGRKLS